MKPRFAAADLLTALRLPLAALFPFVTSRVLQLAIVAVAAATDVLDGIVARRHGGSRAGAVLDPIADKVFVASAFLTIWRRGLLGGIELAGVLLRDIVAVAAFLGTWLLRRPVALPARAGGKAVTIAQLLTLVAALADSTLVRPLAWATAAIAVYAIWDYGRAARARGGAGVGIGCFVVFTLLAAPIVAAQEFVPPKSSKAHGTRVGLFGFGVRGGLDIRGDGQLVLGSTLDIGNLFSNSFRLRPSAEIGVFNGPNTYVGNFEMLWRFTADEELATPYLGGGIGVAGREDCGTDPQCPGLWINVVFGFELHYRSTFNWLVEYHGMDLMRRHRFLIGLTTRRGN